MQNLQSFLLNISLWRTQQLTKPTLKKNIYGYETIFSQKLLVNFTSNYKETASNTFN